MITLTRSKKIPSIIVIRYDDNTPRWHNIVIDLGSKEEAENLHMQLENMIRSNLNTAFFYGLNNEQYKLEEMFQVR